MQRFTHVVRIPTKYQHMTSITSLIPVGYILWYHFEYCVLMPCIHLYTSPILVNHLLDGDKSQCVQVWPSNFGIVLNPVAANRPTYWPYWGVSQQMHLILQVSTTVEKLLSPKRNHNRPSFLLLQRKFHYPQFCACLKTIALLDCILVYFLYPLWGFWGLGKVWDD